MNRGITLALAVLAAGVCGSTHGHHSTAGIFERDRTDEIEGVVTVAHWRNPHAILTVAVAQPDGTTVDWTVETGSLSLLRLQGLDPSQIAVGDRIRAAGLASARGRKEIFAYNMLLPSGKEVLLQPNAVARWPEGKRGDVLTPVVDESARQQALATANGIFRVWITPLDEPRSWQMFTGNYSLTAAAREKRAQWDPLDYESRVCASKAVPRVMNTPLPVEFARRGNDIVMRIEEGDVERVVHMTSASRPPTPSRLGYSTGRWEAETLIVTTDAIEADYLDGDGTPQSRKTQVTERFTANAAGDRLDYSVTVVDPDNFVTPVTATRYWLWQPGVQVQRFDCNSTPQAAVN